MTKVGLIAILAGILLVLKEWLGNWFLNRTVQKDDAKDQVYNQTIAVQQAKIAVDQAVEQKAVESYEDSINSGTKPPNS